MFLSRYKYQLLSHACFALTQGVDPASDHRYPLADVEVESLHKGGLHTPATGRHDLRDGQPGAEDHAVLDANKTSAPIRFHDLGIEQLGQWHPPRLRSWPCVLASFGVHPGAKMRQD